MRVMKHWNRFPGEVVDTSSLEHSRSGWMGLWATWSSRRSPCSLRGVLG